MSSEPTGETERYLAREVDGRMVRLIDRWIDEGTSSVIDVACGSGIYGAALAARADAVDAIDLDPELTRVAGDRACYRAVFTGPVDELSSFDAGAYDVGFCSEFLEHVRSEELDAVVDAIEHVVSRRLVITVPNPRSPHFRQDPTHVLEYRVTTLARRLNERGTFDYRLLPLGFADQHKNALVRLLDVPARRWAPASPTVAIVGDRRHSVH